jgi:hypothetical protein
MKRAWDQMLLDDYREKAKKASTRQEEAPTKLAETARNMYYIISSFGNI